MIIIQPVDPSASGWGRPPRFRKQKPNDISDLRRLRDLVALCVPVKAPVASARTKKNVEYRSTRRFERFSESCERLWVRWAALLTARVIVVIQQCEGTSTKTGSQ